MQSYDLIVIGLGAIGSAALCQSALRGARVLGIDRFHPPHEFGSTHGETRITRQAIGEGPQFVPLVLRANLLWRALEEATGEQLLVQNGGLILLDADEASGAGADFYRQTVACARQFHIAHQILGFEDIREQYPQFTLQSGAEAYFEPGAGMLYPEKCVRAQLTLAQANHAELRTGEIVTDVITYSGGVTVHTDRSYYTAASVVLAPGPWMADWARTICGLPESHFAVYRQTLYWFALQKPDAQFSPQNMPIFLWSSAQVEKGFYGFPSLDGISLKVATEQFESLSRAQDGQAGIAAGQAQAFYDQFVRKRMSGVAEQCLRAATCFYTVVPDHSFLIDHAIDSQRIWFASACSGHGFKHSAAVGEALAQKALGETSIVDLSPFARRPTRIARR